ncbi:MAG TPA: bifunctional hydroxymethylpyrimidine kinase/phosphomethylpyrimidine kinase [Pyrinomonadaceae bacterium]|nr:bifunctional hydroxymethylpyrimidine kinase/phosphomethylpyrimidine kinase [Pyrinomonadaceae bacterium]
MIRLPLQQEMTGDQQNDLPVVLTVAGFDPSGGAGIIADIKTFVSFGRTPTAAITSLTFQNSEGVFGATHESAASLRAQILPIVEEFRVAAVKTGMLPTREIVLEVARLISEADLPAPVVDPVLRSTSGYELMEADAIDVLIDELMPLARLITPNIPEAEKLTDLRIEDEAGMRAAACKLRQMGARAVLIKGGHLHQRSEVSDQRSEVRGQKSEQGFQAIDVLDDEGQVTVFRGEWIDAPPVRGTGCMLSAAIAACLAQGVELTESVKLAKQFVANAIRNASRLAADP